VIFNFSNSHVYTTPISTWQLNARDVYCVSFFRLQQRFCGVDHSKWCSWKLARWKPQPDERFAIFAMRLLLSCALCAWALARVVKVCSVPDGTVHICEPEAASEAIAWATFENPYEHLAKATDDEHTSSKGSATGGWPVLRVVTSTSSATADAVKMTAAGYAEGFLTQKHVLDMHLRVSSMRKHSSRIQLRNFISQQWERIVNRNYTAMSSSDTRHAETLPEIVALFVAQVHGLTQGYAAAASAKERLDVLDILELNYDGDAFDIVQAVEAGVQSFLSPVDPVRLRSSRFRATAEQLVLSAVVASKPRTTYDLDAWVRQSRHGRCTAVIIASQAESSVKIWAGHNTWADYLELNRIFKTYSFALSNRNVRAAHAGRPALFSFSSYPGMITSTDDWYELSSGLLVTETTTSAVDTNVLSSLSPSNGLPAWMRLSVANAVSRTAAEWASVYAAYNGGTYNCMWMVVDAKLIKEKRDSGALKSLPDLPAGALIVVEQSPKRVWSSDMTFVLRQTGVWISANRPFSHVIRRDLGYPDTPVDSLQENSPTPMSTATSGDSPAQIPRFREQELHGEVSRFHGGIAFRSLGRGGERAYVEAEPYSRFQERLLDGEQHGASRNIIPAAYFSYADNPRGRILQREAKGIQSTLDMQRLMRLNDYRHDQQSIFKPYLAVAARFDLADTLDSARSANGAIDAKVAEVDDIVAMRAYASLGPTSQGLPPFNWRTWNGAGFCGSLGRECAQGDVNVLSLCGATNPVPLPCEWDSDWGVIQA
jgi:hypothetical protein